MSAKVESVRPTDTLARAQTLMRRRRIHHLVVVDHGQVVGMLSEGELQIREAEGVAKVEDAMSRHVVTCSPEMTVRQAANLMRGRVDGALPVFANQRLVGIVTVSDLLDLLGPGGMRLTATERNGSDGHDVYESGRSAEGFSDATARRDA